MNICGKDGGIAPVAPGPLCSIQFIKQDTHTQIQIPRKKKSLPQTIIFMTIQYSKEGIQGPKNKELVNTC
jgi:hypothetical protein